VKPSIPTMPPGLFRYKAEPQFVRWPGDHTRWFILGSEDELPIGKAVEVQPYSSDTPTRVEIICYIAERNVLKRDGTRVRYVLCEFDNIVEEPKSES